MLELVVATVGVAGVIPTMSISIDPEFIAGTLGMLFLLFSLLVALTCLTPPLIAQDTYPLYETSPLPHQDSVLSVPLQQPRIQPEFRDLPPMENHLGYTEGPVSNYFEGFPSNDTIQLMPHGISSTIEPILLKGCDLSEANAILPQVWGRVNQPVIPLPNYRNQLPDGFVPWWHRHVTGEANAEKNLFVINLDTLLQRAVQHSPFVQIRATETNIKNSQLLEQSAQFDWNSFLETRYDDQNTPVGNTLTTGNNDSRFSQRDWYAKTGVSRTNQAGGEIRLSQRFGHLDNNSRFLVPPNQGNSRLELNYRQPLLRGNGRAYNQSTILLAHIDLGAASDSFVDDLQQHLIDVTEVYWELVSARAEYFQRLKLLASAQGILSQLEDRASLDSLTRQIKRARVAVAKRNAEIQRSLTRIRNAESRLRLLVNDPELLHSRGRELAPIAEPVKPIMTIELPDALTTSMSNRPDISRSIRGYKRACVQLGVAKNESLPKLDFVLGSYLAGLDEGSDVFGSWSKQFKEGRPSYNVGFEFEIPIGNRVAKARQQRRQWEFTRALKEVQLVVETAMTDVEIAVREVETAKREMSARYQAMLESAGETEYLIDRWQTFPDDENSVTLLLENLLDSQERLADEESAFTNAQVSYSIAIIKLKRAMGTLFVVR